MINKLKYIVLMMLVLVMMAATAVILPCVGWAASPDVTVPERSRVCMMQDTVMATPAIPLAHGGKTYYGCCEMCKAKIAADPARHTVTRDPVTGATVDKATAELLSVDGRVFYFESDASRGRFRSRLSGVN